MPRHGHEPIAFSMVLSGSYEEVVGSERRLVKPPYLVFHPADEEHAVRFGNVRTSILRLELSKSINGYLHGLYKLNLQQPRVIASTYAAALATRMAKAFESADPLSELTLEACAFEALGLLAKPEPSIGQGMVRAAQEFLDVHFTQKVGLEESAKAVGVHPGSLARSFKAGVGCTVGDYVRRKRLDLCSKLLIESELSIADIAMDSGFADQAHLTRCFKEAFQILPSEFRKAYRCA